MANIIYNRFKANLMNKIVDLEADTINVALMGSGHSSSVATNSIWTDVSANELAASGGYSTGGAVLAGKAVTEAATTKWDATDIAWTSATFTAYYAVLYDATATSNLICSFDFGGAQAVASGTFTIVWHTDGIITLA